MGRMIWAFLMLALTAIAQPIPPVRPPPVASPVRFIFNPQSAPGPAGLSVWQVLAINDSTTQPVTVLGAEIIAAALKLGISPETHGTLAKILLKKERLSVPRIVGLGAEGAGWVATTGMVIPVDDGPNGSKSLIDISGKWKVAIPAAAAALRVLSTTIKRELPPERIPDEYLPGSAVVPPGGQGDWIIYGLQQRSSP